MTEPLRLRGFAASAGIAIAPARVLAAEESRRLHDRIDEVEVAAELQRFRDALERSRAEIGVAKKELTARHGTAHASILDVYLLMHDDAVIVSQVEEAIRSDRVNSEWAIAKVTEGLRAPLLSDSSSYLRERARDIDHFEEHLLRQLRGDSRLTPVPQSRSVLVVPDLTPADAVRLLAPPTAALVTAGGALSSHTSILARAFGVPTVVGVGSRVAEIQEGEEVLVDGFSGDVTARFDEQERREAESRQARFVSFLGEAPAAGPSRTEDGIEISVFANVGLPSEVEAALESGASGVGLYRTELMCLDRAEPPSEDEQARTYEEVVSAMAPRRVVFRTFDWRGDKRLRASDLARHQRSWLRRQIRAILRASRAGAVSVLFPMISTVSELRAARRLVEDARAELGSGSFDDIPVGMMVEVPSAAVLADRFARHTDFFAVGTNDLAHHTLALSRGDVAGGAAPLDPSVLQLVAKVTAAADRAGLPCSLCGDVAANPIALGLMVGLGFRSVSVPVTAVPLARAVIGRIDMGVASGVAHDALACETSFAVRALLEERLAPRLDPLWKASDDS